MFKQVILLTGMPRSGTSWLSQIFDSSPSVRFRLSPLFSYEFKNALDEHSGATEWRSLLERVYLSDNDFLDQSYRRRAGEYPTFAEKQADPPVLVIKDTRFHILTEPMLAHVESLTVIAIVRHPCGAIHSWLTAPREFPPAADPMQEWRHGGCRKTGFGEYWGFEDWKNVTAMFMRLASRFPAQVMLQRYENLVRSAEPESRRMFSFCDLPFTPQTEEFLRASQQEHVDNEYAVFKSPNVADRWRTELLPEIRDAILADVVGTEFARFAE